MITDFEQLEIDGLFADFRQVNIDGAFCRRPYNDGIFSACYLYQDVDMLSTNMFKKFLVTDRIYNDTAVHFKISTQIDF